MLKELQLGDGKNLGTADGRIALDCSIRSTRQGHYVISTTDFFFPLVDAPYVQGLIGAANVLSDLYAEGTGHCDYVLMLLAVCRDMPAPMRKIVTAEMVRGFNDACAAADTVVTGGQTVLNPWPIIGGVATSIVSKDEFVPSDGAQIGNVLVLTKPLGTQVAVNLHQWKRNAQGILQQQQEDSHDDNNNTYFSTLDAKRWKDCQEKLQMTEQDANKLMHDAVCSMVRLNKHAGQLMTKYQATAGTDVTGFGILGHAQNLAENQKSKNMVFQLHTLPILKHATAINNEIFNFRLIQGYSAETSGGLLLSMSKENAPSFMEELQSLDGTPAWIVGEIVAATSSDDKNMACILDTVQVLEV